MKTELEKGLEKLSANDKNVSYSHSSDKKKKGPEKNARGKEILNLLIVYSIILFLLIVVVNIFHYAEANPEMKVEQSFRKSRKQIYTKVYYGGDIVKRYRTPIIYGKEDSLMNVDKIKGEYFLKEYHIEQLKLNEASLKMDSINNNFTYKFRKIIGCVLFVE